MTASRKAASTPVSDREHDREPQPSDGPDYHAQHAAWRERQKGERDPNVIHNGVRWVSEADL